MPRASLISLFAEFARYRGDVAVVQRRGYRRESWTYGKLAAAAVFCAGELKKHGVGVRDRVLLWGPNSAEWMVAFWGCLLCGAVAVPMDDGATVEFAARVACEASVRVVVASREKASLGSAFSVLKLEDLAETARRSRVVVSDSAKPPYESMADEPVTRDHIAQILFTSGTTAEPRGVVLTHGNFLANLEPLERGIDPYRKYEKWFHPLRFVTLVPVSHVFGQIMGLFVPALLGATVVFELSANPAEIIRTVKRERATAVIAVPRMLDGLRGGINRDLEADGKREWFNRTFAAANGHKFLRRAWKFRSIHRRFGWKFWAFICGGAALLGETEEFFKRMGYAVVQGYGMTETASLISLNHPFRAAQGSVGKVLPGREFRVAEDGEILVRGGNVASGYWEGGALRTSEESGWLRTGDVGEMDAQGNLRFRGRKKNVIVTPAGLNVYPEDLEAALRKQPGVRDCVVVAIERNGNAEPCAALLMNAHDESAAGQIIEGANSSLAEYQRMHCWMVWPEPDFPRTPSGKPKLAAIADVTSRFLGGQQRESSSADGIADLLAKFIDAGSDGEHLDRSLSLTSLDRVELMSALEQRYQVELSETAFAEAQTIGDVERLLREPSSQGGQSAEDVPATVPREFVYPRWIQLWPARWVRLAAYYALVWPAAQILAHPKIVGRENLRGVRGPLLIVSNHVTRRADVGLILAALPTRFRHRLATAIGGETLQEMRWPPCDWFFGRRWAYQAGYWLVIALFNVFPLPRFSGFRASFRFAGESVDRGYSVLVFPEGVSNDTETGHMNKFHSGIGLLADNLGVPIVPMRMDGVWKMRREGRRLARLGEITLRIGKPVTFPAGTPPEQIADALRSRVEGL